jgi:hypothetical protein
MLINKSLGFYKVDGLEFDSKILACIHATKFNKKVEWCFNNDIFDRYPWHIEPAESLDQLYDRRSKELREKYDYIIISYSGGADSHNVVESFLRQGLHIDELLINTMSEGNGNFMTISENNKSSHNAAASEHVLQTIPRLKEIQNRSPRTKITIVDLTKFLFSFFDQHGDASWVETKREGLNPLNVTRYNYLYFSEVRKKFDKDKKIAIVVGVEKPRTFIHSKDNNFYIRFNDRAANIASVNDFVKEYPNSKVEYFYWSPDSVALICKQAHVIKRWLEINAQYRDLWVGKTLSKEVFRLVHERVLRTLMYSTWKEEWFQADKSTKDWYSEFDSWFIQGHANTKTHAIWLEGLKYVEQNAANFLNVKNNQTDGLMMFNHDYKIGPMASINNFKI